MIAGPLPMPSRSTVRAVVATATLFSLTAFGGIRLAANPQHFAAIWLSNAVLLGALLRAPRRRQAALLLACFASSVGVNWLCGVPFLRALAFSAINIAEAGGAALLLTRGRDRPLDLTDIRDLLRFSGVAGVLVPMGSGLLAMLAVSVGTGSAGSAGTGSAGTGAIMWAVWPAWWATAALGLLIGTPLVIAGIDAVRSGARTAAPLGEAVGVMTLGLVGTAAVFAQPGYPLLFLVGPLVVLTAFRLGTPGTTFLVAGIVVIGIVETAAGRGPIAHLGGGMAVKLLILQIFFLTCFAMGLPVSALLAGLARTRAELKARRDFSQTMLENMREVIFRADATGHWVFLNPAWEQVTGFPVTASLGQPVTKLLHPDDLHAAEPIYAAIVAGTLPEAVLEQRFHTAAGACRHVEVSVRALWTADGRFDGTIGNIRDVTERKQAEEDLAASEAQLQLLATNATDAVFRLALDGTCLYASRSVGEVIGIAPRHLVGANMISRFHPDDDAEVRRAWARLRAGAVDRTVLTYRSRPIDRPDTWRWLEANCGLVRDADGRPGEAIVSIRDITDRKALELDLAAARDAAQVAAQAKTDFLANMSHEIRTPMNGVIGFTELLLASEVTTEQRRHLRMVAESGRAMMRLLNDILDLSKIEAGHMMIAAEPMDPCHSARGCLQLMVPQATRKGLRLDLHRDDAVPDQALGDDLRFRQILLNLLGNAVKFTAAGSVEVFLRVPTPDRLEIEVRDTGIGIAPERQAGIFDQFVQADVSIAREYGGTGLGLAISAKLARLLGGSLRVSSVEGAGTSFFLTLPLVAVANAPVPVAIPPIPAPSPAPVAPGRPRILLAEDHEINQMLTSAMLDRMGARVHVARDGAEAVQAVAEAGADPFALVLMDMQMPHVDGLEACRRIRASGVDAATLPIVALTANAFGDDVEACLLAGMQGHLAKPLQMARLAEVLREWTGERVARAA